MSEKTENHFPEYKSHSDLSVMTTEKLRSLHSNPEFINFLDEYWGVQQCLVYADTFKLQGFYLSKAVKNITFNDDEKLFPPWCNIDGLTISNNKRHSEDYDGNNSWLFRMRFNVGDIQCALETDKNSTVLASNRQIAPIKLDDNILPEMLSGFTKGLAHTRKSKVNGQKLNQLSQQDKTDLEGYQDSVEELVDMLADIDDKKTEIIKTPVLISMDGVGMEITNLNDEHGSQTQIYMATSNPIGIMVYQLKISTSVYDQEFGHMTITRQAIDGTVENIEKSIAENGYEPTILDPVKDAQDYDRIIQKIDKYLSGFMCDIDEF